MTPEQRKDALVGLLGRLRSNAGARLPARSGDEEEFVPKSVVAARAAAAQVAAVEHAASQRAALDDALESFDSRPRFVPDDVPLETDPPPTANSAELPATLEEALLQAEEAEHARARAEEVAAEEAAAAAAVEKMESAPPTPRGEVGDEAPSIEMGDDADLELDMFDPFDEPTATGAPDEVEALVLDSDPPPAVSPVAPPAVRPAAAPAVPARPVAQPRAAAQPPPAPAPGPPAPPASLTRAIPPRAPPIVEPRAAVPPPAPGSSPGSPPGASKPMQRPAPPPPGSAPKLERPRAVPAPPPPAVAAVAPAPAAPSPPPLELPFDEQTEERDETAAHAAAEESVRISEDELERTVNMPPRKRDPLAQTAQNPIPAAFERAVLRAEGALVPPMGVEKPAPAEPPPPEPAPEAAADEPVSSKQPRALDREGGELDDEDDDADEPPQSGEIASQRQPSTGQHAADLDLDGATPSSGHANEVAAQAMALLDAEAVPSAPPPTRPAVMGRRPLAVTSFLDVLDEALSLGD